MQQVPLEAPIVAEEEIASSQLSLEEEIDKFRFVEDKGPSEKPVDISNSETESANLSSVHPKQLVITWIDSKSEEEEEEMDQKKRPGLKGLLANNNKRGSSKEAPKTQPHIVLPPPPPPTDFGLQAMPNLKKRRPDHELEEGELAPQKDNKQQKVAKDPRDKRGTSVDSRDDAKVRRPQRTWAPRIEMEGVPIPYDTLIWDAQRGHSNYLAQALQQLLLLPRDMESIRCTRQPDLFMSLKRDLAMVSCIFPTQVFKIYSFFFCCFDCSFNYIYYLHAGHSAGLRGRGLGAKCP